MLWRLSPKSQRESRARPEAESAPSFTVNPNVPFPRSFTTMRGSLDEPGAEELLEDGGGADDVDTTIVCGTPACAFVVKMVSVRLTGVSGNQRISGVPFVRKNVPSSSMSFVGFPSPL